jgi:V-type H+-transporting ATPase subunit E
MFYL